MKIRNYKKEDYEEVAEILLAADMYHPRLDTKEIFERKRHFDPDSMMVLEFEKKIVGSMFIVFDPWNSFVSHLAVHPEYRGKGFGTALTEEAEERLRKKGALTAIALVENESVLPFYTVHNWKVPKKVFLITKVL